MSNWECRKLDDEWEWARGKCCCNCRWLRAVFKHPLNEGAGKGSILEQMGYACTEPGFVADAGLVFFDGGHGLCECWEGGKHD